MTATYNDTAVNFVSLPLAQKLKTNGYPQDSSGFFWAQSGSYRESFKWPKGVFVYDWADAGTHTEDFKHRWLAAPTTDDVLRQTPIIKADGLVLFPTLIPSYIDGSTTFIALYESRNPAKYLQRSVVKCAKPADAMAHVWLWAKQNGYIDGNSDPNIV